MARQTAPPISSIWLLLGAGTTLVPRPAATMRPMLASRALEGAPVPGRALQHPVYQQANAGRTLQGDIGNLARSRQRSESRCAAGCPAATRDETVAKQRCKRRSWASPGSKVTPAPRAGAHHLHHAPGDDVER